MASKIGDHPDIILIRHGQTEWNRLGRFQGSSDIALDDVGLAQAEHIAQRLLEYLNTHGPDADGIPILSSPLRRARQTARIVARRLQTQPANLLELPELREISYGDWEGMTTLEVKASFPKLRRARKADRWRFVPPGGESHASRLASLRTLLDGFDRPSVIVSHAGVLRICLFILGVTDAENALVEPISQDKIYLFSKGSLALI
ncbi:histidine phosphatase family protein [Hoeflea prorocentri]|uniref:Histidine phosphatase family protein n=1 Tax=Hoeflea prorocentri TaxID=1922333 RepID=A0A9X3UI14_9HYPH|nr:histidine phosphatase family protein [Hoeflea prorocentri]MCY6380810.1 histidine phosphatase family protein [Hoeflea prorocentri]MDA5398610.1 histidine phosphatase family protein [Hoeflea prorocentri]